MEAGITALWKKMAAQTRVVTVGLVRHSDPGVFEGRGSKAYRLISYSSLRSRNQGRVRVVCLALGS